MKALKPTILLVEDLDENRAAIQALLTEEGYEVVPVSNPDQASAVLREQLVHLALIDVRLRAADENDMRGLDLCRSMKADIPRILFTAYPNWEVVQSLGAADADSLVDKGAEPHVLLSEISRVLSRSYDVIPRRRFAILTSGGDAPGMNAAIWSALRTALAAGVEVFAIYDGYEGLIQDRIRKLRPAEVDGSLTTGGTMLGTARSMAFASSEEKRAVAADNLIKRHIDGLIIIGGDGSIRGAQALANIVKQKGSKLQTIALPGTIDNDVDGTEMSIGAASAVVAGMHEINNMLAPARALRRVFVCEVMGQYSGFLTLEIGLCVGADAILLPEELLVLKEGASESNWLLQVNYTETRRRVEDEIRDIAARLERIFATGKRHAFVLVAEGLRKLTTTSERYEHVNLDWITRALRDCIESWTLTPKAEVRSQVIGYPMRGAPPSRFDIHLGTILGEEAVRCLLSGKSELMIGVSEKGKPKAISFDKVLELSSRSPAAQYKQREHWKRTVERQRRLVKPLPPLR
jgi:6-phosphofructokinase 1